MSWPTHQSLLDTRSFLNYVVNAWSAGKDFSFSIRLKETNRLIGSFGIMNDEGKLQFGYILSPTQWGNGYATEVCSHMMQMLKNLEGVIRIQTFVDVENTASAKVLLKSGLTEEAMLKDFFAFVNQGSAKKDCVLFKLP